MLGFSVYAEETAKPAPATIDNPAIELDALRLQLKPLTAEELEAEATAWQNLVKEKATELSETRTATLTATDDQRTQLLEQAHLQTESRISIADRYRAVLLAWQAKGGDISTHEQYLKAVSAPSVSGSDATALITATKNWFRSKEGGLRWGINLLKFLGIMFAFSILARMTARVMEKLLLRTELSDLLKEFIENATRKIILILGFIIALASLEVNIGPLLAGIGVVGFILGFALQDTLSNFASGFMILLYHPYDVGNFVTVAGVSGSVESMNLVSTTLKTPDNQKVVIPNGKIWGDVITNTTGNKTRRVDLTFGIGYGDDLDKAQQILEDIVAQHEHILKIPEPVVRVHELADSSVNFVCRPWVKTSDYWTVYWDLIRTVKERFDQEGISIPFPQQDVYMHQVSS